MVKKIRSEDELKKWFIVNYKKLGYDKIVKGDTGIFPDFIMCKKGDEISVELETLSSNFLLHGHDISKVDEVVCVKEDVDLGVPTTEIKDFEFSPRVKRISATIDEETDKLLDKLLKDGTYRNKSHIIEKAIEFLKEMKHDKK